MAQQVKFIGKWLLVIAPLVVLAVILMPGPPRAQTAYLKAAPHEGASSARAIDASTTMA
jgi:hypothetical protein